MSDVERLAHLESWTDSHESRCTERYERIASDTTEIKAALIAFGIKLESAVARIHDRIDGQNTHTSDAKVWALKGGMYLTLVILGYALSHWGPLK